MLYNNKDKEFDSYIKEKLENAEVKVPAFLWDSIEKELELEQPQIVETPSKEKKKSKILYLYYSGAIAAVLCLFIGIGIFYQSDFNAVKTTKDLNAESELKISESLPETSSPNLASSSEWTESAPILIEEKSHWKGNIRLENTKSPILTHEDIEISTDETIQKIDLPVQYAQILSKPQLANLEVSKDLELLHSSEAFIAHSSEIIEKNSTSPATPNSLSESMDIEGSQNTPRGVSRILNFVVATVDKREEKFIYFTQDKEGSIKAELNLALNKK